jgi:hypothetical protein
MSINSNLVYTNLTCQIIYNLPGADEPQWLINGPLSGDLVCGLLMGLQLMCLVIILIKMGNDRRYYNIDEFEHIPDIGYFVNIESINKFDHKNDISIESRGNNIQEYYLAVKDYFQYTAYDPDMIAEIMRNFYYQPLDTENYYWWISNTINDVNSYNLVSFKTNEFVQGFISMCNGFNVDFREYVLGYPFKFSNDKQGPIFYGIEGYNIDPFP